MCLYFDSMLILCKIFIELEHFILFNNLVHNFIYDSINIKLMVHRQFQGKKITQGLRAILPPKCKKEPLKIAIDCNVKACLMLQI